MQPIKCCFHVTILELFSDKTTPIPFQVLNTLINCNFNEGHKLFFLPKQPSDLVFQVAKALLIVSHSLKFQIGLMNQNLQLSSNLTQIKQQSVLITPKDAHFP